MGMNEREEYRGLLDRRLLEVGWTGLSDAELLAVALGRGRLSAAALSRAQRLLEAGGSLARLRRRSVGELLAAGWRSEEARVLAAVFELGRRARRPYRWWPAALTSSRHVYEFFRPLTQDLRQECFWVLLLDAKHRVQEIVPVSVGAVDRSLVHPREVFRPAVREGAAAVLFVHNHPSGDPAPSREDLAVTARLVKTAEVLGIRVLDHLIVGAYRYFSFADEGLLGEQGGPEG
ncbi:MAG: DNA repair protein RadC [Acidobacteriota bacterium]